MKILIDTNILIQLEDNNIIAAPFSNFYQLAITNGCRILYHPDGIPEDIKRDKDTRRRDIIMSKLSKYEPLRNAATPSKEFLDSLKNNKPNDYIDNIQLLQAEKNYVDFFITQDKGIHKKANQHCIQDKVMKIDEILDYLTQKYVIVNPDHPILKSGSIRDIEDKFSGSFFDSLREDYDSNKFNCWLRKCIEENRECYYLMVDEKLSALLIYNIEDVVDHKILNIYDKVLKICTLKVADTAFGIKLGELFLHKMFEYCIKHSINYLYLTVYEKQEHLIYLLLELGFEKQFFENSLGNKEIRMIKCMDKSKIKLSDNSISIHPFYSDNINIKKYVIPIRPNFYNNLFKDSRLRQPTLFDSLEDSIKEIHGNTIIKAYISSAKTKALKKGDLLFFYSSKTNQVIEPIGILESVCFFSDFDELWMKIKKKTVFSQDNVKNMLREKGILHCITFRLVTYTKHEINLNKIQSLKSLKNNIVTITTLSENDYKELKNDGYFDERYIID